MHAEAMHDRAAAAALVVSKATARAADELELTNAVLGKILGISASSASRLRSGSYLLEEDSKSFEIATLFLRLFRGLDAIVGGDRETARAWLRNANTALGAPPIALVLTVSGLMQAVQYVDARRARV
jgi:hypothetical protein